MGECNTKMLALLPLFLLFALSSASPVTKGVCGDFLEGACDLSENNILDHNRYTDTPAECQDLCSQNSQCHFFTHFSTQCYLLAACAVQQAHPLDPVLGHPVPLITQRNQQHQRPHLQQPQRLHPQQPQQLHPQQRQQQPQLQHPQQPHSKTAIVKTSTSTPSVIGTMDSSLGMSRL